jgi:hypothetical protein
LFQGLAYVGFFLNLFNLVPIGFLDGGRIVTALSPWLWLVGTVIIGLLMFAHFNFLLLLIFLFSLPRLFSLFRRRSAAEARYFEVTPDQRWIMGGLYFGLIALLVLGMMETHSRPVQADSAVQLFTPGAVRPCTEITSPDLLVLRAPADVAPQSRIALDMLHRRALAGTRTPVRVASAYFCTRP